MINEALRQSALMAKEYGPFQDIRGRQYSTHLSFLENATEEVLGLLKGIWT